MRFQSLGGTFLIVTLGFCSIAISFILRLRKKVNKFLRFLFTSLPERSKVLSFGGDMYTGTMIQDLHDIVNRAFAEQLPECTFQDLGGYECGAAAVLLLLPGEEARCIRHIDKPHQF